MIPGELSAQLGGKYGNQAKGAELGKEMPLSSPHRWTWGGPGAGPKAVCVVGVVWVLPYGQPHQGAWGRDRDISAGQEGKYPKGFPVGFVAAAHGCRGWEDDDRKGDIRNGGGSLSQLKKSLY